MDSINDYARDVDLEIAPSLLTLLPFSLFSQKLYHKDRPKDLKQRSYIHEFW